MAKPIREFQRVESTPEERQAEAVTEMIKALSENKSAILETVEILGQLHKLGVLSAVKSLLQSSHEVGVIAVQQFNQPKMHNIVKNVITATQSIGNIDPEDLQRIFTGFAHGLETAKKASIEGGAPTLWEMAKIMREPAVRTSMATMLSVVKGVGEALQHDSPPVH